MWTDSILDTGVLGWDKCSWVRQHVFEVCCHIWIHFQKTPFNNVKIAQIVNTVFMLKSLILITASFQVSNFTCEELGQWVSLVLLITQSSTSQPAQHILPGCRQQKKCLPAAFCFTAPALSWFPKGAVSHASSPLNGALPLRHASCKQHAASSLTLVAQE